MLNIYNIYNIGAVTVERVYELPPHWSSAAIGFTRNTAPLSDHSVAPDALFYPDPSTRVLLITAKSLLSNTGRRPFRNWLFINESFFRPTSRKERLNVSWDHWKEYCIIRDVSPSTKIPGPYVIGSRVLYVDSELGRSSTRDGHARYRSKLTVIDFAPYPDVSYRHGPDQVWPFVGQLTALVPNETTREIPSETCDRRKVEDMRVTEDNVVLFLVRYISTLWVPLVLWLPGESR